MLLFFLLSLLEANSTCITEINWGFLRKKLITSSFDQLPFPFWFPSKKISSWKFFSWSVIQLSFCSIATSTCPSFCFTSDCSFERNLFSFLLNYKKDLNESNVIILIFCVINVKRKLSFGNPNTQVFHIVFGKTWLMHDGLQRRLLFS